MKKKLLAVVMTCLMVALAGCGSSAGGSGNGVFTAAKEAEGVYCIGCDVDQYDDGVNGSSNIILTSVLKGMDVYIEEQLGKITGGLGGGFGGLF